MTDGAPRGSARFATTRWSVVLATRGDAAESRAALETLCASYWYPLYAYARRRGRTAEDAADLVQGFFLVILRRGGLASADPERGRFRTFLLTAFQRHASHERDREQALKRGGGRVRLPFEIDDGERRYTMEPADDRTPEALFERRWALALLDRAVARLREDQGGTDAARLDALLPHVYGNDGGAGARPYGEIASSLGMSEGAVKVAVHRLRKRFRDVLREEVSHTVEGPDEVDDELRRLIGALATPT